MTMLLVALPGPPFVIAQMIANSLRPQMNCKVVVITMMPRIPGTVTFQNRSQTPAPSTVAASIKSWGRVCNPASSISVKKGKFIPDSGIDGGDDSQFAFSTEPGQRARKGLPAKEIDGRQNVIDDAIL